ncbi:unnamed protein product [Leuciscus chuanchicus]
MTPHTFAAELMRRLQELQTHTRNTRVPRYAVSYRHTEEETDSSSSSLMADSDVERSVFQCSLQSLCVTVVYYYSGDEIPYRTRVRCDAAVTLGRFKSLLTRTGPFRFFFKRASAEFECGAVYEEILQDEAVLPMFERKIMARYRRRPAGVSVHERHRNQQQQQK